MRFLKAWLRRRRPFDRRQIRDPVERDRYWNLVKQRLAEIHRDHEERRRDKRAA